MYSTLGSQISARPGPGSREGTHETTLGSFASKKLNLLKGVCWSYYGDLSVPFRRHAPELDREKTIGKQDTEGKVQEVEH